MRAGEIEVKLGLPLGTLASKRVSGDGPKFYKLGRRTVVYLESGRAALAAAMRFRSAQACRRAGSPRGARGMTDEIDTSPNWQTRSDRVNPVCRVRDYLRRPPAVAWRRPRTAAEVAAIEARMSAPPRPPTRSAGTPHVPIGELRAAPPSVRFTQPQGNQMTAAAPLPSPNRHTFINSAMPERRCPSSTTTLGRAGSIASPAGLAAPTWSRSMMPPSASSNYFVEVPAQLRIPADESARSADRHRFPAAVLDDGIEPESFPATRSTRRARTTTCRRYVSAGQLNTIRRRHVRRRHVRSPRCLAGSRVAFLGWPHFGMGSSRRMKRPSASSEYFETWGGHPRLPPSPWNLFDDALYLPKLPSVRLPSGETFPRVRADAA